MRIAYKNIIDSLTSGSIVASSADANYPVTDVQDQRLSTKWIGTGSTDESVIFTLDTFPTYPDNVSGQSYFQHFDTATTDSWISLYTSTNETIYATTSSLILKAGVNTIYPCLGIYRTQIWSTSQTLILKTPYDSDLQGVAYYNGTSYTTMSLVNDNDINYFAEASMVRGSAYSFLIVVLNYASAAIAATKTIPIDYVYLGDGSYTTQLLDNSNNGNDATVYNCIPTQDGLLFNGINSYFTRNLEFPTKAFSISFWIKTLIDSRHVFGKYGSAGSRQILIAVGSLSVGHKLNVNLYSDGTTAISFASSTSIDDDILRHCVITFIPGTSVNFYINGALDVSRTTSVPSFIFDSSNNFTGGFGSTYFNGYLKDTRIYNRALSDSEIEHLYNSESFITENDGLIADWALNKNLGVNTVSILGHNIKTGTEVKIQASDNNYWTDPPVDETLTVNTDTILKFLSDTYYYKYWKFYFLQGSTEIGRLWLGSYLTINPSSLLDFNVTSKRSDMVIHGKNRSKFASVGIGWRQFELDFPRTEETMIYQLSEMIDYVGNHSSVIFSNFDTDYGYTLVRPCYVSIAEEVSFQHTERMKWEYSLVFEEEL